MPQYKGAALPLACKSLLRFPSLLPATHLLLPTFWARFIPPGLGPLSSYIVDPECKVRWQMAESVLFISPPQGQGEAKGQATQPNPAWLQPWTQGGSSIWREYWSGRCSAQPLALPPGSPPPPWVSPLQSCSGRGVRREHPQSRLVCQFIFAQTNPAS